MIEAEGHLDRLPKGGAPRLRAHLAGVALTSPDPRRLAGFYMDAMGYRGEWHGDVWTGSLAGRRLSIRPGSANSVDHSIFALPDPLHLADLRGRLVSEKVGVGDIFDTLLSGPAIELADPDGNRLVFGVAADAPATDAPDFPRLQHIVFASDEAGRMVRFYCDVLGFAPSDYVSDEADDLTSAFLRCSPEHHSIAVFRAPRKRLDHLCYDVADWTAIRDWADRFADRRITLRWGPGRHGPGNNLFFFVNDPDGNWIEFSTELELVEGPRETKLWIHEERTLNSWGTAFLRS